MIYVLIMYCSGFCGPLTPPPSDVLLFTSYAECEQALKADQWTTNSKYMQLRQTCAPVEADPKQLNRLFVTSELETMLKNYQAHGDGYKPWRPSKEAMREYGCTLSGPIMTCKYPTDRPPPKPLLPLCHRSDGCPTTIKASK